MALGKSAFLVLTMPTQKKIETVEKLAEKLTQANGIVLTDYHGLTHQQLEGLKKAVKAVKGDFIIVKNTLLKLALEKLNRPQIKDLTADISGPTALLLSHEDVILPLRELAGFIKKFQLPIFKIGILEDRLLDKEQLFFATTLPVKDVLVAKLLGQLSFPLYRLQTALVWNLQKLVLTLKTVENIKMKSSQS